MDPLTKTDYTHKLGLECLRQQYYIASKISFCFKSPVYLYDGINLFDEKSPFVKLEFLEGFRYLRYEKDNQFKLAVLSKAAQSVYPPSSFSSLSQTLTAIGLPNYCEASTLSVLQPYVP